MYYFYFKASECHKDKARQILLIIELFVCTILHCSLQLYLMDIEVSQTKDVRFTNIKKL